MGAMNEVDRRSWEGLRVELVSARNRVVHARDEARKISGEGPTVAGVVSDAHHALDLAIELVDRALN